MMPAAEDRSLEALLNAADELVQCVCAECERRLEVPANGSRAAQELAMDPQVASPDLQTPVANAYAVTNLQIAAAGDLVSGTVECLRQPGFIVSPIVLARAALEASARAWWLLDPSLGWQERAGRGVGALFETLRRKRTLGPPFVSRDESNRRIREVARGASHIGAEVTRKKGEIVWVGARSPDATTLAKDLLRSAGVGDFGAALFRWYCAVAHVQPLGLVNIFSRSDDSDPDSALLYGRLTRSRELTVVAAGFAVLGYGEAIERRFALYGWDDEEVQSRKRGAMAVLKTCLEPPSVVESS